MLLLLTYKCQHQTTAMLCSWICVFPTQQLCEPEERRNERFVALSFRHCLRPVYNNDAFSLGISLSIFRSKISLEYYEVFSDLT